MTPSWLLGLTLAWLGAGILGVVAFNLLGLRFEELRARAEAHGDVGSPPGGAASPPSKTPAHLPA